VDLPLPETPMTMSAVRDWERVSVKAAFRSRDSQEIFR
jgi:hypothetical protein